MKMIKLKLLILALCLPAVVFADGSGGFSGSFLRIGLGARALAMGNAQVATADNGYGAFYNPAALPRLDKRQLALSYSNMSLDREFNYVGVSLPLPPVAGASAGWINSGVGDLRSYNSNGEDTGEVNHGLNAFYFSFGVSPVALAQLDNGLKGLPADLVSIGLTVKFLRESIGDGEGFDYSGKGLGIDFGVLIKPTASLTVGYQLKDMGSKLESNTNNIFERGSTLENAFPLTQKAGLFYKTPFKGLAVAYDFEWNDVGTEKQHIGLEMVSQYATGRIGYNDSRFTAGGGLDFQAYKKLFMMLDYAFIADAEDEGFSHVFSWRFLF